MDLKTVYLILILFTFLTMDSIAQQKVSRRVLLSEKLASRPLSAVNATEIIMEPFLKAGLHQHPCPVVGYVAEGTLLFQIKGEEAKTLKKGDVFYEPANTAISHFDNASDQPLKFIAFYLTNGEQQLIEMLQDEK